MAYEITLPRLGWDMTEGALDSWRKKEGEFVREGEILFEMEGDKAVQEIEAMDSGYLRILPDGPRQGEKKPVGTVIGYLVPEAELADFRLPGSGTSAPVEQVEQPLAVPANITTGQPEHAIPSTEDGRTRRIYISPYAKRMADSLGVEWKTIRGSGLAGRIMAKDIETAAALHKSPAPLAVSSMVRAASETVQAPPVGQRIEMTQIRKKIAEHMAYSAHTAAPVTLTSEVDATELAALRKVLKDDAGSNGQVMPSYNDLLAKLCAQALRDHPRVNARIEGDEILQLPGVNIAFAVDTDRGLIVPVLRDVQTKSVRQIASESAVLIEKTRAGTISYAELQGATFTITNLGMFDIDAFTPIIDLPQCAILGVGRIVAKQVVIDAEAERVAIRKLMVLSLTFDHRLIDGAQAAKFLQRVKKLVENPYLWLVG